MLAGVTLEIEVLFVNEVIVNLLPPSTKPSPSVEKPKVLDSPEAVVTVMIPAPFSVPAAKIIVAIPSEFVSEVPETGSKTPNVLVNVTTSPTTGTLPSV